MKEFKNIDEVFKENAADFKLSPSKSVWDGVNTELKSAGIIKSRNYYKYILLLLVLLFAVPAGWYFLSSDNSSNEHSKPELKQNELLSKTETKIENTNDKLIDEKIETKPNINKSIDTEKNAELNNNANSTKNSGTLAIVDQYDSRETKIVLHNRKSEDNENDIPANENDLSKVENNINSIFPLSIYSLALADAQLLDKELTWQKYIERKRKIHTYTSLNAKIAMTYYPNTTDQFTWASGVDFGIILKKFYVESGIAYQEFRERGVYDYTYKSNDSIGFYNRVVSFEINPQNPEEITYKTQKTTVFDSLVHINTTAPLFKYSFVNVPLRVGYVFFAKDRLKLAAEAGMIYSHLIDSKIPEASFDIPETILLKINDKTPERNLNTFRYSVALRFNYRIVKSVSLNIKPEFTKYVNSVYKNQTSKPYTMGIGFGLTYNF